MCAYAVLRAHLAVLLFVRDTSYRTGPAGDMTFKTPLTLKPAEDCPLFLRSEIYEVLYMFRPFVDR